MLRLAEASDSGLQRRLRGGSIGQSDSSLTFRMTERTAFRMTEKTVLPVISTERILPFPSFRPSESERRNPKVLCAYTWGFLDYARNDIKKALRMTESQRQSGNLFLVFDKLNYIF